MKRRLIPLIVFLLAAAAAGDVVTVDSATGRIYSSVRRFLVPYEAADSGPSGIKAVRLYYTTDDGARWTLYGEKAEPAGSFEFVAPSDGTYGFVVQAVDNAGHMEHKEGLTTGMKPEISVVVDTSPPQIEPVFPREGVELAPGAHLRVRFRAHDPNLAPATAAITARKDEEEAASLGNITCEKGEFFAMGDVLFPGKYTVEITVADRAGNIGSDSYTFECTKTPKPVAEKPGPMGRDWLVPIGAPPRAKSLAFDIDYRVEDIGGQPPASVGLWYTSDDGATWQFYGLDPDVTPPFRFQAPKEGVYGFKLTATTRSGVAEPAPRPGKKPEFLTLVDVTYPTLMLDDPRGSESYAGGQVHYIRWTARDDHFGSLPISLYVSREGGPWELLAADLPNDGIYGWNVPLIDYAPYRMKIDARDQVGNRTTVISDTFYVVSAAPETRIKGVMPSVAAVGITECPTPALAQAPAAPPVAPEPAAAAISDAEAVELVDNAAGMRMRGEYEQAEELLRKAIAGDKKNVKARVDLGALLTDMGRQEEAVEILTDARALAPDDTDVLYNLAAAYYLLGKYDECVAALETLVQMEPSSESALWSLAKAYYAAGRIAEARGAWQRIIALDVPRSSFAERARRALATVSAPARD